MFASFNMLKRQYYVVSEPKCSGRDNAFEMDEQVSLSLAAYYKDRSFFFTFVKGYSNFIKISLDQDKSSIIEKVDFSSNPEVVVLFSISAIIAIVRGAYLMLFGHMTYKVFSKLFQGFIAEQKALSLSRKVATN